MIDGRSSFLLKGIVLVLTAAATSLASTAAPEVVSSSESPLNGTSVRGSKELYANKRNFIWSGMLMFLGVFGNSLALYILSRKKATKNSKYTLMLRCLSSNNLIALVGMLVTLMVELCVPKPYLQEFMRFNCMTRVLWRFFGLSSGCIAAVMAVERWMALARPFIYHKHITYELIRKTIYSLVFIAVFITFLPFVGFGAYFDDSNPDQKKCIRYRDAEGFLNKTYSILFLIFGCLLCLVIVVCNTIVTVVLYIIGRTRIPKGHMHYDLVNREKGSNNNNRFDNESSNGSILYGQTQYYQRKGVSMTANASAEEIKFAKLMIILSFSFVICWMPQMIAIPLAIKTDRLAKNNPFFIFADILMALHFTSDPYVYVISRTKQSYILGCFKSLRGSLRRTQSEHSDQSEQSQQSRCRTIVVENTSDGLLN